MKESHAHDIEITKERRITADIIMKNPPLLLSSCPAFYICRLAAFPSSVS